jgi:hypothetical protein
VSLITLGLALDYKTEGGLAATDPITISSRPFFWQQMERTRANFVTLNDLAPIKMAQVTLTDANVKALPTTPISLIAAPASGTRIVPLMAHLKTAFTAGAYTNINSDSWLGIVINAGGTEVDVLGYVPQDAAITNGTTTNISSLFAAANSRVTLPMYSRTEGVDSWGPTPGSAAASSNWDAKALSIKSDNNGSGVYTGGNAANTMLVTVLYLVL